MIDILFVDEQVILATTALMMCAMAVMNLDTWLRAPPTRFLHQECHANMEDLIQGINTPTSSGTNYTPIMAPDIGDITAGHNPIPIPTMTKATV